MRNDIVCDGDVRVVEAIEKPSSYTNPQMHWMDSVLVVERWSIWTERVLCFHLSGIRD